MLLMARALGLGATLTTLHLVFEREVEAALGLPPEAHTYAILPIGYPLGRFGPVRRRALSEVVYEMSRKGLGHTAVVGADRRLLGIISDGDLRRALEREGSRALGLRAQDLMTRHPSTIRRQELATRALNLMETRKITSLLVVDSEGKLEGAVHIHDLWSTEMF
jgi:arabinose-5-phosphate isomerase